MITDGSRFFQTPSQQHFIRLSISKCNETEIREGIRRMAKAIEVL